MGSLCEKVIAPYERAREFFQHTRQPQVVFSVVSLLQVVIGSVVVGLGTEAMLVTPQYRAGGTLGRGHGESYTCICICVYIM